MLMKRLYTKRGLARSTKVQGQLVVTQGMCRCTSCMARLLACSFHVLNIPSSVPLHRASQGRVIPSLPHIFMLCQGHRAAIPTPALCQDIREELEEALEEYDDGDGEIEFKEFQEMVSEMRSFQEVVAPLQGLGPTPCRQPWDPRHAMAASLPG